MGRVSPCKSEKSILKLTSFLDEDKLTSHRSSSFRDARLGGDLPDDSGAPGGGVQRLVRLRQRQAKKSFNLGKDGRFLENTSCSEVNEFVFFLASCVQSACIFHISASEHIMNENDSILGLLFVDF